MNVLVVGKDENLFEFKQKFADQHNILGVSTHDFQDETLNGIDIVFNFILEEEPDAYDLFDKDGLPLFMNSVKTSLREFTFLYGSKKCNLYGFNGLPTFINRKSLELSALIEEERENVKFLMDQMKTDFHLIEDRVGMVSPRVVCMIINEAYYTVQEGTASRKDIDLGMKLGTAYPYGPFEWCEKIGVKNVYEVLKALYDDTKDERYKICPLLKKEYLGKI